MRTVELIEGLTDEQRSSVTVELGFLPEPVPLVVALGLRLNEVANHGWDVRAGLDPSAEVDDESATVLLELFSGPLAFVLGFSGRPGEVDREVRLAVPGGAVVVDDQVRVTAKVTDPTATLAGPRGAAVRLLSGRLKEPYVGGVHVTGDVTLEELRRVFPGCAGQVAADRAWQRQTGSDELRMSQRSGACCLLRSVGFGGTLTAAPGRRRPPVGCPPIYPGEGGQRTAA